MLLKRDILIFNLIHCNIINLLYFNFCILIYIRNILLYFFILCYFLIRLETICLKRESSMKKLRFIIKIIFCKIFLIFLQRILFLTKFFKIKLILKTCFFLSKIRKIRTHFIICIIFVLIWFSKIIPSGKLGCLKYSFYNLIIDWNNFLILFWILFNDVIWNYHTVCVIF